MSLGKVSIAIEAQMASFESDMGRASRVAEKNFRKMERDAKRTEENMKRVGKAIGLALVAGATAATVAIKGAINAMDDMSKAAQRANMPTEDFSRLAYAGKLADVSMQDLQGSLGKLAKAQGDAMRATSTQARVFEGLGIAVKNADGSMRSTSAVFKDFADRFQQMKGSPEIMAAGMNIFGRSFQNLIPLLKDGSAGLAAAEAEADRLGITLSTKAGQQAEQFNDNLTRLKTAAGGLAQQVAAELLPRLVSVTDEFANLSNNGETAARIARSIEAGFGMVTGVLGFVAQAAREAGIGFGYLMESAAGYLEIQKQIATLGMADGTIAGGMARVKNAGQVAKEMIAEGRAGSARTPGRDVRSVSTFGAANDDGPDMAGLRAALAGGGSKAKKGGAAKKSDAEREAESLQRALQSLMATQAERIALFGKEDEVSAVTYATQFGALSKLAEADKARLLAGAAELDMLREKADAAKEAARLAEEVAKAEERHAEQVSQFIKDQEFELSIMKLSNIEREKAIALRYLNVDAMSAEGMAIADNIEKINAAAENAAFLDDFKRGLADAFVDFASGAKSAKDAFGDFADYLFKRALQMMADKAIQAMFDAFSGDGQQQGGGDSGGGWGGLLTAFMGAYGGGKAAGGPVSGSKFYEVGEQNRPEMFHSRGKSYLIPGNEGNVIPFPRGGQGNQQTVNFHMAAPTDPRTQSQIAARVAFETNRATARNR